MDRRSFLTGSACALAAMATHHVFAESATTPLRIQIDRSRTLGRIPSIFTGLGYEISSASIPGLLSPSNHSYIGLVRALGSRGVVRVGGNTSDFSSFRPDGKLVSSPKATVINSQSLSELSRFLDATDWQLIWGLNLGSGSEQQAALEAQAVSGAVGSKLLAFEIGNEPDLFAHSGHRPASYSYEQYLQEYRRYKSAIRAQVPAAPFAGPDVALHTEWAVRFAKDEGHDLKLLTHHYYRGGASNPHSSLNELLAPDPNLSTMLDAMRDASREAGIPYRIVETNSFSGGGKRGVSDTFGSALWALDYMFTLASHGAAGLNMETGMNQLGFVSPYSPIMDDQQGHYTAAPDYYGMLAFSHFVGGELLAADYDAPALNATVYAAKRDGNMLVAIINKDRVRAAEANIAVTNEFQRATAVRLTGPSLESTTDVTLGGSTVGAGGQSRAASIERIRFNRGCRLHVPAASAALVTLYGK
ncbi:MAG TPA: hypothetical protein VGT04_11540 [Acidobacteriaceae bacterium]|nr:hypothetical protein [Acidobacteriaceae bacterium]